MSKVLLVILLFSSQAHAWSFNCQGRAYSKLDNGSFAYQRVKVTYTPAYKKPNYYTEKPTVFEFEKTNSETLAYELVYDNEGMLNAGFRRRPVEFRDFRFDQESLFKLRDRMAVGFIIACRI